MREGPVSQLKHAKGTSRGIKTPFDSESIMPELKSRPISEASFSQARKAIWKPPEDRTHDLPANLIVRVWEGWLCQLFSSFKLFSFFGLWRFSGFRGLDNKWGEPLG